MSSDDSVPTPARRRRITPRRSANRGFDSGGLSDSTIAEGVGNVDPNEEVEAAATSLPVSLTPRPGTTLDALGDAAQQEDFTPLQRLKAVAAHSSDYEKEYRLQLLHRLLMRKIPLDEIARSLGVSISTIMRDRRELHGRLREESRRLDIDLLVGNNKGFYEEVVSMAMRAASNASIPMPMRLAAMRTALASQNDMHRFFQASGVYDVLRYRVAADEGAASDIDRLMRMTEQLIAETKQPQQKRNINVLGEFSGADGEVLDI